MLQQLSEKLTQEAECRTAAVEQRVDVAAKNASAAPAVGIKPRCQHSANETSMRDLRAGWTVSSMAI